MTIYKGDNILAHVELHPEGKLGTIKVEQIEQGYHKLWAKPDDKVTIEDFTNWLEYRCVPKERDGIEKYLKAWGLKEYNRLAIIKVTHGRMAHDDIYIQFEGE